MRGATAKRLRRLARGVVPEPVPGVQYEDYRPPVYSMDHMTRMFQKIRPGVPRQLSGTSRRMLYKALKRDYKQRRMS